MPLYRILSAENKLQPFRASDFRERYQEKDLEDWMEANPEILVGDEPLLIIGRQVNTPVGIIDLLALDSKGSGVVIELKKAPGQREAVSQSVEYASWLADLSTEDLRHWAEDYLQGLGIATSLREEWQATFGSEFRATAINETQRLFVVIEGVHDRMASMIRYLRSVGLDISLLSYSFYRTETGEEIMLLEPQVGEMESGTPDEVKPSESGLMTGWSEGPRQAYSAFKSVLLEAGLYARPKKTGMSFSLQTVEGSVFVCFFNAGEADINVWIRNDSMQALIDFDRAAEEIKQAAPTGSRITHKPVWFIIRSPASEEVGATVARLVLQHIVTRLKERH